MNKIFLKIKKTIFTTTTIKRTIYNIFEIKNSKILPTYENLFPKINIIEKEKKINNEIEKIEKFTILECDSTKRKRKKKMKKQ
jgi:hypothetical protein